MLLDLYTRLRAIPLFNKVMKYALGSGLALATSVVVFALLLTAGVGTTIDSIAAFVAGAIPNWILNRKWAWKRTGQINVAREVVGYIVVSLLALVMSSAATGGVQDFVRDPNNHVTHGLHTILITGAYVFVQAVLFAVKFVIYDRWVFAGRSRVRAALRSRHQVFMAARANRTP